MRITWVVSLFSEQCRGCTVNPQQMWAVMIRIHFACPPPLSCSPCNGTNPGTCYLVDTEEVPNWHLSPQDLLSPIHLIFCWQVSLTDGKDFYSPAQKDVIEKIKFLTFLFYLEDAVLFPILTYQYCLAGNFQPSQGDGFAFLQLCTSHLALARGGLSARTDFLFMLFLMWLRLSYFQRSPHKGLCKETSFTTSWPHRR